MSETTVLTKQQDAAINERTVSIALSAGAGCGKTFVLTQRFLALLDPKKKGKRTAAGQDPLGGIVAITFTDRAAREMRDRIRAACHKRLATCSDDETEHWLRVVRALDSARISTIHSFCSSILRANAVDAKIDPQFALLDRNTGSAFQRTVVSETVLDLLGREDADCVELVLHFGLERTNDLLRELLPGRFQAGFERLGGLTPETLAEQWIQRWNNDFVPELMKGLRNSHATQLQAELLRENEPSHKVMRERRAIWLERIDELGGKVDQKELVQELRSAARVEGGGGKSAWDSEETYEAVKNAMTQFRKDVDRVLKDLDFNSNDVETAAKFTLVLARVLRQLYERYESEKQEAAVLDFDDLLLRTRDLLRDETVRERVQAGIQHLMVDEFQDTDPVQAQIVELLCGDRLVDGRLFLVGDAKQSIYRFRRADPAVFAALRNRIDPKGRLPLSTNFRSQPAILNFVNCLFAPEMDAYEALEPHVDKQQSPTPAIEFLFARPDSGNIASTITANDLSSTSESDDEVRPAGGQKEYAEDRRMREADWIARRIAALLADPEPRIRCRDPETGDTTLRCVQPGDITILFRALTNIWLYEDALRMYGIPYYLVGGRAFYAQQEVFDLVNLCSFLNDRDDQVSLAGVLRSPFFSLSDDTLYAMVLQSHTLAAALLNVPASYLSDEQQSQWSHASRVLGELLESKDQLPLAGLLKRAIELTGYDAALLAEFLGERKVANLRKLVDMARQFDRAGLYTTADFVERIRDSVLEQSDEELAATHAESSDVVRLMSIHQSKGLEFPVVIVADVDAARNNRGESAVVHPELGPLVSLPRVRGESVPNLGLKMHKLAEDPEDAAEVTRLFYVATTRAADYLILSAGLDGSGKVHSPWMKLLSARFDLDTGLPARDPYLGKLSLGDISPDKIPAIKIHHAPPEVPTRDKPAREPHVALDTFRSRVEATEPGPLPPTMASIAPDFASRRQFSVSVIERAVELFEAGRPQSDMSLPYVSTADGDAGEFSSSPGDNQLSVSATTFGSLVHEVIERLDFSDPTNIDSLITQVLRSAGESNNASLKSSVAKCLHSIANSPLVREMAEATVCHRELDFLLQWPSEKNGAETMTISGQIDCLLRNRDGKWKIIDYKTGLAANEDPAKVLKTYEIQLTLYAIAARELIVQLPDEIELVVLGDAPKRIPFALSEKGVAATAKRIDQALRWLRSG